MAANGGAEDDDYMGDLSLFLPRDAPSSSKNPKQASMAVARPPDPSKLKRPRAVSWQEQRRLNRGQKQREEDHQTLVALEAAIPESNLGFKMLRRMGYNPGSAIGRAGPGLAEPVGLEIRRSRAGIGALSPAEEAARRERTEAEKKRRKDEELAMEFGSRQKMHWRSRRVVGDYRKAEAALAQLENREIAEPKIDEGLETEKLEEDEEEEEITEEDLNEILIKLRDEHSYCLYCGCRYESAEALKANCPGPSEDDH